MSVDSSDLMLPESDRQELILWTMACVARLLPIFEATAPEDTRLATALDGAHAFSRAELGVGSVRELAFQCHAAAREVQDLPATAVARACGHAVAVAHMAGHSRQIGRYTAKALSADREAAAAELAWQRQHVPARFRQYVYGR